jgi:polysaccharide biosynthesis PFTS motif protein
MSIFQKNITKYYFILYKSFKFFKKNKKYVDLNFSIKDLINFNFDFNKYLSKLIFGKVNFDVLPIIKQLIVKETINDKIFINKLLLSIYYNYSFSFASPVFFLRLLKKNHIRVNIFISRILFYKKLFFQIFKGLILGLVVIFIERRDYQKKNNGIFFIDFTREYLLPPKSYKDKVHIVDWFNEYYGVSYFDEIYHSVKNINEYDLNNKKISYLKNYIPSINSYVDRFKFFIWLSISFLLCIFFIFNRKWVNSYLFIEAIKLKKLSYIENERLPKVYLFSNTSSASRPLWTYLLEEKKSKALHFHYSCSFYGFKNSSGEYPADLLNNLNAWDETLVWSKNFSENLKNINPRINIHMVKPIYFTDNNNKVLCKRKCIAMFDLEPTRKILQIYDLKSLTSKQDITFQRAKKFLEDISQIADELNLDILWKQRWDTLIYEKHKNAFNIIDKRYINFCKKLSKKENIIKVHSYTSFFKIINQADLIISFPFTSTGIIANIVGKKSVYYDSTNIIVNSDRGSQGVKLISDSSYLKSWIKGNIIS